MDKLYNKLNISNKYYVENGKLDKNAFLAVADLLSSDKKLVQNSIKKMTTKYSLKPSTINLPPYISADRDYYEIDIMEVVLKEPSKYKRIAEILMRTIPYPLLLIFIFEDKVLFATGDMRKNLSDGSKVTVDDFVYTDWIDVESDDKYNKELFASLDISSLNATNYYTMYQDITAKLNLYNISKAKGEIIESKDNMSNSDIKACYDKIKSIEEKISALKSKVKKAGSIREKVELNIQIDNLKKEIDILKSKI